MKIMNISEMIDRLTELREKHGDLPCFIHQQINEYPRMMTEKISAELTQLEELDWESFEAMEEAGIVNSIVITDCPD